MKDKINGYRGKRLFDIVVSGALLVAFFPVLAAVWCAARMLLGQPVIFRQSRPGLNCRPFTIMKFRTMTNETDSGGSLLPDAQRLSRFGSWLRSTSLDELPELVNVLKGDMSLVGPRPLLFRYIPYFTDVEMTRFDARPGITGLAQISGRNLVDWDRRLGLDVQYVQNASFLMDLRILATTALQVVSKSGVSADVDQVETWLDEERAGNPQRPCISMPCAEND